MQNNAGKTALGLDLNIGALLCYVNVCLPIGLVYSIIVLVTDKDNKLPRFHAFQSLLTTGLIVVLAILMQVVGIIGAIIDTAIGFPILSLGAYLLFLLIILGVFVMIIIAAVKAFGGNIYKLPIVGSLADNWSN